MSGTWHSQNLPESERFGVMGALRAVMRGVPLILITFGCLILLLLVRLIERPIFGLHRPITPYITQFVCRSAFVVLRLKVRVHGTPSTTAAAFVSNHSSWLDIFTLNAQKRIYFVSKSEVAKWPGIGWLARATGTVFIKRRSTEAKRQQQVFNARLKAGHQLLFFPEGTSTDGLQVLPFKSTLFQSFFDPDLGDTVEIQPVTLTYHAPDGLDARFYGWWGDMEFGTHLYKTLATPRHGVIDLTYHDPVSVSSAGSRKELAADLENRVRSGLKTKD